MRFCAFSGIIKSFHFLSIMNLLGFCDLKTLAIIKLWDCLHCKSISYIYFSKLDKILQFNPNVYNLLRGLDKEKLTNVFLGEALADLTALLSEDLDLFWYLCLPVLHTLWTRYHHVIV